MERIDITPEMELALRRYEIACARFVPGRDSTSDVELPLLAIGTAAAAAIGLPGLRELFHGGARPRFRAQPVKVPAARQGGRRVAR